jgi:hypothetical protein
MVLTDHLRKGDPGFSEMSEHCLVIPEHLSCSVFAGPSNKILRDSAMEFPMYAGSAKSGSFRR